MKKISFVFVAALALAAFGCKKKSADCGAALDHSMELAKADMQKQPGMDDKMMQKMKDIALQHCKDDKWSDEALKCMTDAKTEADAKACYGKLTPEQTQKMNDAAMEAAKAAMGGAAGGAAGSAPPAGGDTGGSAAAGSAPPAGGDTGGSAAAGSAPPAGGSAAAPK